MIFVFECDCADKFHDAISIQQSQRKSQNYTNNMNLECNYELFFYQNTVNNWSGDSDYHRYVCNGIFVLQNYKSDTKSQN